MAKERFAATGIPEDVGCFNLHLKQKGGKHKRTAECLAAEEAANESDRT